MVLCHQDALHGIHAQEPSGPYLHTRTSLHSCVTSCRTASRHAASGQPCTSAASALSQLHHHRNLGPLTRLPCLRTSMPLCSAAGACFRGKPVSTITKGCDLADARLTHAGTCKRCARRSNNLHRLHRYLRLVAHADQRLQKALPTFRHTYQSFQ